METKKIIVVVLILLGLYFFFAHYPQFPLSHEELGLFNHDIHHIIGTGLITGAGVVWWFGRSKK